MNKIKRDLVIMDSDFTIFAGRALNKTSVRIHKMDKESISALEKCVKSFGAVTRDKKTGELIFDGPIDSLKLYNDMVESLPKINKVDFIYNADDKDLQKRIDEVCKLAYATVTTAYDEAKHVLTTKLEKISDTENNVEDLMNFIYWFGGPSDVGTNEIALYLLTGEKSSGVDQAIKRIGGD